MNNPATPILQWAIQCQEVSLFSILQLVKERAVWDEMEAAAFMRVHEELHKIYEGVKRGFANKYQVTPHTAEELRHAGSTRVDGASEPPTIRVPGVSEQPPGY